MGRERNARFLWGGCKIQMNEILICDFEGPDLGLEATPYTKLKQSVNVLEVVP